MLWLFLRVPWVGLQYVIVVFPDHTHLLFDSQQNFFLNFGEKDCLLYGCVCLSKYNS